MAKYDSVIKRTFHVVGESGDERIARCPFHDDKGKPNLYANAANGLYLCHACGAKGHMKKLAAANGGMMGTDLSDLRERLMDVREPTPPVRIYPDEWLEQFNFPHDFWVDQRGFSQRIITQFKLGYDVERDCATIPIRDSHGRVLGVITRRLDDGRPKYMFPKGFKKGLDLFGSWLVRKRSIERVALVEGPLDAVACWDAKVPALALHGARITADQQKLLKTMGVRSVVTMTDNDSAGIDAMLNIKESLTGITVLVGQYRPGWDAKDPGELSSRRRLHMFLSAKPWWKVLA